ncbi:MAG TPA: formyltetrahydrofolate deformylase [Sneathiellales bacterium]|nr:formyltetrahydrofolate deformylase [Sneathiellales bacterium]
MSPASPSYVLKLLCPDRMGIVAGVSGFLAEQDCNIVESSHFGDENTEKFFMRAVFVSGNGTPILEHLQAAFAVIGNCFKMDWAMHSQSTTQRVMILVSKIDHYLNDLLYRYRTGKIAMEIPAVVSNHPDLKPLADFHGIPFHHLPVTADTKPEQEAKLMNLVEETGTELLVLARYMQILTDDFCSKLSGRIINIHHSFLPSFKGAKPYHQAPDKGVKLIGATAHYVTPSLDEGPIIEQDTVRVSHVHTAEQMVTLGSNVENIVLARAVSYHLEHRVLLNGSKTVVFA